MYTSKLGEFIKDMRQNRLKLNRKQFAELTSIDYGYLTNIERGDKVPSADMLIAIAQGLRLRPGVLLDVLADTIPADEMPGTSISLPSDLAGDQDALSKIEAFIGYLVIEQAKNKAQPDSSNT